MSQFFVQIFNNSNPIYSVVIEDDGRVAYAYLLEDNNIIGDIWLYNQIEPPMTGEWKVEDMPFLNPSEFLKNNVSILPIMYENEVDCKWGEVIDGQLTEVVISLSNDIIAKMCSGSNPGWSTQVSKDGPLAKVYNL
jgi:hypothetical protein